MKIALVYSYNGSGFSGSQTQPHGNTIEDAINKALARLGIFEPLLSSSRTDKDVHALMQVSTTYCADFWSIHKLKEQIARHLPPKIALKNVHIVPSSFHPRYDASARAYRYILAHGAKNPYLADFVYYCQRPDIKLLNAALNLFCGEHDFSGFYKLGSNEKSSIKELYYARARSFNAHKASYTIISLKANGFLRSQVRLMVANSLKASANEGAMDLLKARFIGGDLSAKIPTKIPAPPQGLYLKKIFYPVFNLLAL